MSRGILKKFLDHPDREEIIAKLVIGVPTKEIHQFLAAKYTNVNEVKFVIADKSLRTFRDNYLDIYNAIYEDLNKTKQAVNTSTEEQLALAVQNNEAYRSVMLKTATQELDIRQTVKTLAAAIETRLSQVFDQIQEDPRNINTRVDRLLIEYTSSLGEILEKYHKFTEVPVNPTIQHNVTLQVVDQHITVFHDVIKDVLSKMDLETSLYFMEVFNEKMSKLRSPEQNIANTDVRLAEVKLLNETINNKINGI